MGPVRNALHICQTLNLSLAESDLDVKEVCKVFETKFVTPVSNASRIAFRWSAMCIQEVSVRGNRFYKETLPTQTGCCLQVTPKRAIIISEFDFYHT